MHRLGQVALAGLAPLLSVQVASADATPGYNHEIPKKIMTPEAGLDPLIRWLTERVLIGRAENEAFLSYARSVCSPVPGFTLEIVLVP